MMIEPIKSLSVDVVPQAVVGLPIYKIVGQKGEILKGSDDFDSFEGAFFKLNNSIEIAVRHYRGHPRNTTTIYVDRKHSDVKQITLIVHQILDAFNVPRTALQWQRSDNPEL
jgi:hypothetical protein